MNAVRRPAALRGIDNLLPGVGFDRPAEHSYQPLWVGNVCELLAYCFIGRPEAFLTNQ
jgi:hypothetical protein